jgi:hypothetical protein
MNTPTKAFREAWSEADLAWVNLEVAMPGLIRCPNNPATLASMIDRTETLLACLKKLADVATTRRVI